LIPKVIGTRRNSKILQQGVKICITETKKLQANEKFEEWKPREKAIGR